MKKNFKNTLSYEFCLNLRDKKYAGIDSFKY